MTEEAIGMQFWSKVTLDVNTLRDWGVVRRDREGLVLYPRGPGRLPSSALGSLVILSITHILSDT